MPALVLKGSHQKVEDDSLQAEVGELHNQFFSLKFGGCAGQYNRQHSKLSKLLQRHLVECSQ